MNYTIYNVIVRLVQIYEWAIIIWCVLSWIPSSEGWAQKIRDVLGVVVEPYLSIFRRFIPPVGGIDFSPIIAFFVLSLVPRLFAAILLR